MMFMPQEYIQAEVAYRREHGTGHTAEAMARSNEPVGRHRWMPRSRFHLQGHRHDAHR